MTDKAFVKGLRLLTVLAESEQPRSLTSLSEQLDLTKSNTHRLLKTLSEQGFAEQVGDKGHYRATLRLWELGAGIVSRLDLLTVAREPMAELSRLTGETIHLSALDGTEVIYLDKLEGRHAVRSYTRIGARAPAWAVATGKALLAQLPARERLAVASGAEAFTPHTITAPDALADALDTIRHDGIAFNLGEWREDVFGAASPIRNARDEVVAALGISGPAGRLSEATLRDFAPSVIAAARKVSAGLGWTDTSSPPT